MLANNKESRNNTKRKRINAIGLSVLLIVVLFFLFIFNFQHFLKEEILSTIKLTIPENMIAASVDTDEPQSALLPYDIDQSSYSSHEYTWIYKWSSYSWTILIPSALSDYFYNQSRPQTDNYAIYVIHPFQKEALELICEQFQIICSNKNFNEEETIKFLSSFVRSTEYISDIKDGESYEYPKYPIETLCDNGGDCEDKSILLASLLNIFNVKVALIGLHYDDIGHMIVGVAGDSLSGQYYVEDNGDKYYALDATNRGWGIGGIDPKYRDATLKLLRITSTPIILYDFYGSFVDYSLQLTVNIENVGTADAHNYHILAGFDASNNQLWNSEETPIFDLPVGREMELILTLRPPYGKHTRICVFVYDGEKIVDRKYSDWFDL